MISGTTAWARFDVGTDISLVSEIIFTYVRANGTNSILLQRRYPADTEYRDGLIWLPLSQEDTMKLRSGGGIVIVELQINYISGAVAKTEPQTIDVRDSFYTELVPDAAPDDAQRDGGIVRVSVDDVVVIRTGGGEVEWENIVGKPDASQNIEADKNDQTKYATPYAVNEHVKDKLVGIIHTFSTNSGEVLN